MGNPKKKLLITGAQGFIGRNLLERYEDEFDVIGIGRVIDIKDALYGFEPEIVFHCSAEIYDDEKMWESNVLYTKEILDFCAKNTNTKLFLFGSSSEYGRKDRPMSETDSLEPITFYESTKAAASMLAKGYAEKYGIQITLIRPFSVVGRYEKPHKLFPTLYRAFKNNLHVDLSNGVHDFVFIDDFLDAFDVILNYRTNEKFRVINIGSGVQTENYDVYAAFAKAFDKSLLVSFVKKLRSFDSDNWVCDPTLLREKYKYSVPTNFDVGVKKFIRDCERLNLYNE